MTLTILADPSLPLQHVDQEFVIEQGVRDRVEVFATEIMKTVDYRKRRQSDPVKIKRDNVAGKLMEFAAADYFRENGVACTDPDLTIYTSWKKSFDTDLTLSDLGIKVACKSTHFDSKYPYSWLFQYKNVEGHKGGTDTEIFSPDHDSLIAMGIVDPYKGIVYIEWIGRTRLLLAHMEDPILPHLVGIKKVLYHKKLQEVMDSMVSPVAHLSVVNA